MFGSGTGGSKFDRPPPSSDQVVDLDAERHKRKQKPITPREISASFEDRKKLLLDHIAKDMAHFEARQITLSQNLLSQLENEQFVEGAAQRISELKALIQKTHTVIADDARKMRQAVLDSTPDSFEDLEKIILADLLESMRLLDAQERKVSA